MHIKAFNYLFVLSYTSIAFNYVYIISKLNYAASLLRGNISLQFQNDQFNQLRKKKKKQIKKLECFKFCCCLIVYVLYVYCLMCKWRFSSHVEKKRELQKWVKAQISIIHQSSNSGTIQSQRAFKLSSVFHG